VVEDPPQVRAGGEQAEFVGVGIGESVVGLQFPPVNSMGSFVVRIGIGDPLPTADEVAGGRGEEGREDDRDAPALVVGPAEQGVAVSLDGGGTRFEGARFEGGAGVVASEGEHVPGQVFVGINDETHGIY